MLSLAQNAGLVSLTGVDQISDLSLLSIANNPRLTDLRHLSGIRDVRNGIEIVGNPALTSLDGLGSFSAGDGVTEVVRLEGNGSLVDIDALRGLVRVSQLVIQDNDALLGLTGLEGLADLDSLIVEENRSLATLRGLGARTIGGGWRSWATRACRAARSRRSWSASTGRPRACARRTTVPDLLALSRRGARRRARTTPARARSARALAAALRCDGIGAQRSRFSALPSRNGCTVYARENAPRRHPAPVLRRGFAPGLRSIGSARRRPARAGAPWCERRGACSGREPGARRARVERGDRRPAPAKTCSEAQDIETCETECAAGKAAACETLGDLHAKAGRQGVSGVLARVCAAGVRRGVQARREERL